MMVKCGQVFIRSPWKACTLNIANAIGNIRVINETFLQRALLHTELLFVISIFLLFVKTMGKGIGEKDQ